MVKKILLGIFLVAIIAVVSFPYWAGCDAKYQVCVLTCNLRRMGSDIKQAACRGGCVSRKVACISRETMGR
jgi:hypothetical protein